VEDAPSQEFQRLRRKTGAAKTVPKTFEDFDTQTSCRREVILAAQRLHPKSKVTLAGICGILYWLPPLPTDKSPDLFTMISLFLLAPGPRWLISLTAAPVVAILVTAMSAHQPCSAETQRVVVSPGRATQVVNLRDRLVVGLQARLKSEVAFVELVVAKVRTGKLPQHVVDETFFWARDRASINRNGISRRPIIFFQPAMKARAKRLRVAL
jgi:hypothetical protein